MSSNKQIIIPYDEYLEMEARMKDLEQALNTSDNTVIERVPVSRYWSIPQILKVHPKDTIIQSVLNAQDELLNVMEEVCKYHYNNRKVGNTKELDLISEKVFNLGQLGSSMDENRSVKFPNPHPQHRP